MEVNDETFEPKNLVKNPVFIDQFNKTYKKLVDKRYKNRSKAMEENPNIQFCVDWHDRFEREGLFTSKQILDEFKLIIDKKSKKPNKVRNVIRAIYSISMNDFSESLLKDKQDELQD